MDNGGGWVIDLDIQSFFDSVDRAQLRSFLDQRVRDGVIRRAIGKWLGDVPPDVEFGVAAAPWPA